MGSKKKKNKSQKNQNSEEGNQSSKKKWFNWKVILFISLLLLILLWLASCEVMFKARIGGSKNKKALIETKSDSKIQGFQGQ